MKLQGIALLWCAAGLIGCNSTQHAPALTETPAESGGAAKPGFIDQARDATWRVVTAPAKLLPQKAVPSTQPRTYEAPSAIIVRRDWSEEPASTEPAHP